MPLKIAVQSAPEPRGYGYFANVSWTGPQPKIEGVYTGNTTSTSAYLFLCAIGGVIGTTAVITVNWTGPNGTTGRLNLGVYSGYAADDPRNLPDGLTISFPAGTVVAAQAFFVATVARRLLPTDYRCVKTDIERTAVDLLGTGFQSRDTTVWTDDRRRFSQAGAKLRTPRFSTEWLRRPERRQLLDMIHRRHRVTVFENYDRDTILLWRGGGAESLIGHNPDYSRALFASVHDPDTEQLRSVAGNVPRIVSGVETESVSEAFGARHTIPHEHAPHGRAIHLSDQTTNALDYWHAEVADDGTVSLHWAANGAAVLSLSRDVETPLARDGGWDEKWLRGVPKVELLGAAPANGAVTPAGERFTVTPGDRYTPMVWLRGRGTVEFRMRTGTATPNTTYLSTEVTLSQHRWKCVRSASPSPAVPGGHVVADLLILPSSGTSPDEQEVFYIGPAAVLRGRNGLSSVVFGPPPASDGSPAVNSHDSSFAFRDPIPRMGTLSFWMRGPADNHTDYYCVLKDSTDQFILEREGLSGSEEFRWWTIGGVGNRGLSAPIPGIDNIMWETWVHVALSWWTGFHAGSGTYDRIFKRAWVNGVLALDDSYPAANRFDGAFGNLEFFPSTDNGPESDWRFPYNARLQEVRMDGRVLTSAEVKAIYDMGVTDDHEMLAREWHGRFFEIDAAAEAWAGAQNRDKMRGDLSFTEVDYHENSLVVPR